MAPFVPAPGLPGTAMTMDEALAAMDAVGPQAYMRHSWLTFRFLLSRALSNSRTMIGFDDTPRLPMIRGRAVSVQDIGRYEKKAPGAFLGNVRELGLLPKEITKQYGRCHVPNSPVFYAAFDKPTVLAELQPEVNDLVYFLNCVPKMGETFRTRLVGEIDHIRRHGVSSIFTHNQQIEDVREWVENATTEADYVSLVSDAFAAELLTQPCPTQNHYKASSALASLMLATEVDDPGAGEAIYYRSVAHRGGMNIALSADCYINKVTPVSCEVVQVLRNFGHGIYKTRTVANCPSIAPDGELKWIGTPPPAPNDPGLSWLWRKSSKETGGSN